MNEGEYAPFRPDVVIPMEKDIYICHRTVNGAKVSYQPKNNKTRFYHLHIPKTAGNYLRSELSVALENTFEHNGITYTVGHTGWGHVNDYTYTFTSLRDPAKRTVSHFSHLVGMSSYIERKVAIEDRSNLTPKNMWEWIEAYPDYISNYQTKNFFFDPSNLVSGWEDENNVFFFRDPEFRSIDLTKEDIPTRVSQVDLIVKDTQLNSTNMLTVRDHILADFGLTYYKSPHPMEEFKWFNINEQSQRIYAQLSESEIKRLYELNKIDSDLYFTDSIYWNGGK